MNHMLQGFDGVHVVPADKAHAWSRYPARVRAVLKQSDMQHLKGSPCRTAYATFSDVGQNVTVFSWRPPFTLPFNSLSDAYTGPSRHPKPVARNVSE
jgi:hypothetical protein